MKRIIDYNFMLKNLKGTNFRINEIFNYQKHKLS